MIDNGDALVHLHRSKASVSSGKAVSGNGEQLVATALAHGHMVYGSNVTAFNHWATRHGARDCVDGLGMLAEQAALAFSHWTGQLPETRDVMVQLRQDLR